MARLIAPRNNRIYNFYVTIYKQAEHFKIDTLCTDAIRALEDFNSSITPSMQRLYHRRIGPPGS